MMDVRRRVSVCRSLFGPVDHDQLHRDLQLKMKEMSEQDTRRWNFNFQSDTPLPGRFQWEEISAGCAASFQEHAQSNSTTNSRKTEDDHWLSDNEQRLCTNQENCLSISSALKSCVKRTPVWRKRTFCKPAASPRTTARITDFFATRKMSTGTRTSFHIRSSEAAQCKTMR